MRVGILGTGNQAIALGKAWGQAGHSIVVSGRSDDHAQYASAQIGAGAMPERPQALADGADVVVVAVAWTGIEDVLTLACGPLGAMAGKTVIDCTNAVDYATGRLLLASGSAAESVAALAPGAHVVKALHLFAGTSWPFTGEPRLAPVVAICGDNAEALATTAALVGDLGGRTAVLGGLDASRQLEEAAGFVMRLVAAGANPRWAVPDVAR